MKAFSYILEDDMSDKPGLLYFEIGLKFALSVGIFFGIELRRVTEFQF